MDQNDHDFQTALRKAIEYVMENKFRYKPEEYVVHHLMHIARQFYEDAFFSEVNDWSNLVGGGDDEACDRLKQEIHECLMYDPAPTKPPQRAPRRQLPPSV